MDKGLGDSLDTGKLENRLETFSDWTGRTPAAQLAKAGFYYTGVADRVACFSCGISVDHWQDDMYPPAIHKKYAPGCEFLINSFPETISTAVYPHYVDEKERLKSFELWSLIDKPQLPDVLARCGFFYNGTKDMVCCFYCGVTLRNWVFDDYPPSAHAEWSSTCPFAQQPCIKVVRQGTEASGRQTIPQMERFPATATHPGSGGDTGNSDPCHDIKMPFPDPCTEHNQRLPEPRSEETGTTPQPCSEWRIGLPPGETAAIHIRDPDCRNADFTLYVSCEKCRVVGNSSKNVHHQQALN
ncbi:baculoviral IAP repeat-containing protein 7-B-like [Haliotis asinina]|uniref:baculoviral IAP repeat-containing protein 7-B-like n=1 Tax=Haliotis asinina TaxID=109174 RepID=UPI0035325170